MEYLEHFENRLDKGNGRLFCQDSALNAVLNSRYNKLLEAKADVHFNLDVEGLKEIDTYDLCTIFTNALDNALEASENAENVGMRKVELLARREKGYFSFRISNYKENEVNEKKGMFVTSKSKKQEHGLGIENVREIVNKYGGSMEIRHEENQFVLFLYIRLS